MQERVWHSRFLLFFFFHSFFFLEFAFYVSLFICCFTLAFFFCYLLSFIKRQCLLYVVYFLSFFFFLLFIWLFLICMFLFHQISFLSHTYGNSLSFFLLSFWILFRFHSTFLFSFKQQIINFFLSASLFFLSVIVPWNWHSVLSLNFIHVFGQLSKPIYYFL